MKDRIEEFGDAVTTIVYNWQVGRLTRKERDDQICQLFPQHLDDKGLREKLKTTPIEVKYDLDGIVEGHIVHLSDRGISKLLALLPDIEEARKQERERIGKELCSINTIETLANYRQALKGESRGGIINGKVNDGNRNKAQE